MRKKRHTEEFILKIAAELNKTPYEVKSQVNEYLGDNLLYYQAINYLRDLKADDIRFILRFNKW
jgi:AraC-like DNA-binding protein